jgi:RNA polymerase sigma factor (sigma-70 family)
LTHVQRGTDSSVRSNAPALPSCESSPDFDELALPLFNGLYSFARWLARSEADAEDLVQETYLKAFRSFATFQPGTNFQAWIFRILKNTFLTSRTSAQSRLTSLSNSDEVLADLPSDFPDPDTVLMDRVRLDVLQTAMQQLPLSLREVLVSCDLEDASYRETAQALSIPVGTVMSRLARARKALRESVHATWSPLPASSALRELGSVPTPSGATRLLRMPAIQIDNEWNKKEKSLHERQRFYQ